MRTRTRLGAALVLGALEASGSSGGQQDAVGPEGSTNSVADEASTDAGRPDGSTSDAADGGSPADAASDDATGDASAEASGDASTEASGDGSTEASGDGSAEASGDASSDRTGFTFQPSNIPLSVIGQYAEAAMDEIVSSSFDLGTTVTNPVSRLNSPIEAVAQTDPGTGLSSTVDLVVVKSLAIQGATLTVTGSVPLVIVSLSSVTFSMGGALVGNTSTSNRLGPGGGAGGQTAAAGSGLGGGFPATGLLGGGGGSYCGVGGAGGGGTASSPYGAADIRPLVGGSGGGTAYGSGGGGGGAIQIVAAGSINIASGSFIAVSGAAGELSWGRGCRGGTGDQSGGSGAGSGGSILLEAPSVTVAGALVSNGGGGGGGAAVQDGWYTPPLSFALTPAPGGDVGGAGSAGATVDGVAGQPFVGTCPGTAKSAGGGGGGAGRIRINSSTGTASTSGSVISPAQTTACVTEGLVRALGTGP